MTRGRRRFVPSSGSTGSLLDQQTSRPKPNRLSRSFRSTQTAAELGSPKSQKSDFKTPTRISRSRGSGAFSAESPHDSDFQQDIIWDAGSPSPGRLGRRGQTRPAGVVDISEIVSRIAPKHGRPRVTEPTLQQWIGDSATIPCTPDVQVPKPKKKSPRPTGVDDLLKLAKQFDFNMFHREEEEAEDGHQQSPKLLSDDTGDQNQLLGPCGANERVNVDLRMEDDLHFLFDGPTQHVSGTISQVSAAQPSPLEPGPTAESGKHGLGPKDALANDFDDDWGDDDLLNDSLVFEMTQNPQNFVALNHCSTQKPASGPTPAHVGIIERINQSDKTMRQRTSFKLESDPNFSLRTSHKDTWPNAKVGPGPRQSRTSFTLGFSVEARSQQTCQLKSKPQGSEISRTSASNTKPAQSFPTTPDAAQDLDSFFSTDLVWDDPAEDNLLCEMCEDLENQIQNTESGSVKVMFPGAVSKQGTALQLSNRTWDNRTQPPAPGGVLLSKQPQPGASGVPAEGPLADVPGKDSFRNSQTKTGSTTSWSSRVQSAAAAATDQFAFKKPNSSVPTVSNKVLGKCSAAEIELKKQQAMERRRQRLKAARNHQAPT